MTKSMTKQGVAVAALLLTMTTGCVQPWVATRMEEKYNHKNDFRTPLLPPIREGFPEPKCEDIKLKELEAKLTKDALKVSGTLKGQIGRAHV